MNKLASLNQFIISLVILAFVFVVAMVLMMYATPYGSGLGFDSVAYISAARNLITGIGLGRVTCTGFKPMTLWPPLYPILLAILSLTGMDPIKSSHIISILGYSLTMVLAGLFVYKVSKKPVFILLISLLFALAPSTIKAFSWAMSESLYMPISLLSLYLLYGYTEKGERIYLFTSALFIGLAMVTRYIAASLLPVWVIILALNKTSSVREKIKDTLCGLVIALLPVLFWFLRNTIIVSSGTGRKFGFNIPALVDFDFFIKQVVSWMFPVEHLGYRVRLMIAAILFVLLITMAILIFFSQKKEDSPEKQSAFIFLLYSLFYLAIVVATVVFWVPSVSLVDERIPVPLQVNLLILLILMGSYAWKRQSRILLVLFTLAYLYLLVYYVPQQVNVISTLHSDGQGYASEKWQSSPAINDLEAIRSVIYTNDFQALYFISGKDGCILPANENDLLLMRGTISNNKGYVVIFGSHLPEFLPLDEITQGMTLMKEYPEIRIFQQLDAQN